MKMKFIPAFAAAAAICSASACFAAQNSLTYDASMLGPSPVPAMERGLQTAAAEQWLKVSDGAHELEGATFGPDGALYFCDVTARKVMRVTKDKELSEFASFKDFAPGGLAFAPDGRLFAAALDFPSGRGVIAAIAPDGSKMEYVLPPEAGYMPNDVIFDKNGGFYFSDFKGTPSEPKGGIYYAAPDMKTVSVVAADFAQANGVALSPDGTVLWATEFGRNLLYRFELESAVKVSELGTSVPYRFIGPAPDSMRTDADGNVYVAMYGQGRVMAFNGSGIPIGQILLPGREEARIATTSLAIDPGSKEAYIVARTVKDGGGAWIYRFGAFAHGPAVNVNK